MPNKFSIVAAIENNCGIGLDGRLPWGYLHHDMKRFRNITQTVTDNKKQNAVIMGRRTWDNLPRKPLPNRINVVITSQSIPNEKNVSYHSDFTSALDHCSKDPDIENIFVIGGEKVYNTAISHMNCHRIYLTHIHENFPADTYFPLIPDHFKLTERQCVVDTCALEFAIYENTRINLDSGENQYIKLVKDVIENGERKLGRNGITYSLFGGQHVFDLNKGFPLLTTKKVFFESVAKELLFFLRGCTDAKILSDNGVHIWNNNTTREFLDSRQLIQYDVGDMGPMYGWNWRHFGAEYITKDSDYTEKGYDQLLDLVNELINNPNSRRLLLTTYDPSKVPESVLAPCHGIITQFYIRNGNILDCKMYQRSVDIALGYPFNIASYALLTHIIAHVTGYKPGRLYMTLGDTHIYNDHIESIKKQLYRAPHHFPTLKINKTLDANLSVEDRIRFIEELQSSDFVLDNYYHHAIIRMNMIA